MPASVRASPARSVGNLAAEAAPRDTSSLSSLNPAAPSFVPSTPGALVQSLTSEELLGPHLPSDLFFTPDPSSPAVPAVSTVPSAPVEPPLAAESSTIPVFSASSLEPFTAPVLVKTAAAAASAEDLLNRLYYFYSEYLWTTFPAEYYRKFPQGNETHMRAAYRRHVLVCTRFSYDNQTRPTGYDEFYRTGRGNAVPLLFGKEPY